MSLTSRRTAMARKRYKPEEIVAKLRQVDVLVSQGQNMVDAIRQIGVSEVTYYRWRQEFGGLKTEQVKRLKDLELENSRLRKAVSDLTLDKLILQEAARGNFLSPARRRVCIEQVRAQLHVSERRACAALGQHRSPARMNATGRVNKPSTISTPPTSSIIPLMPSDMGATPVKGETGKLKYFDVPCSRMKEMIEVTRKHKARSRRVPSWPRG